MVFSRISVELIELGLDVVVVVVVWRVFEVGEYVVDVRWVVIGFKGFVWKEMFELNLMLSSEINWS